MITSDSKLYHSAISRRALLGDRSVIPELASILSSDIYMFDVAGNVWDDRIMAVAEQHLLKAKGREALGEISDLQDALSGLLLTIPKRDAERFLEKNWEQLMCIPSFMQAALYIGTDKCLGLADLSIRECPREVSLFKDLDWTFGFYEERGRYLTKQHLERLLPYINRIEKDRLWRLADICQRLGIPEWSKEHISGMLTEQWRKRFHPTNDDLLSELDEISKDPREDVGYYAWRLNIWAEEFDKRHDSHALEIVDRWLGSNRTTNGLKFAAAFLTVKGSRKDLSLLDKYEIDGSANEISRIKLGGRFAVYRRSLE